MIDDIAGDVADDYILFSLWFITSLIWCLWQVMQRDVPGIDHSFLAMDTEEGVEVVWNEVQFSERKYFKSQEVSAFVLTQSHQWGFQEQKNFSFQILFSVVVCDLLEIFVFFQETVNAVFENLIQLDVRINHLLFCFFQQLE